MTQPRKRAATSRDSAAGKRTATSRDSAAGKRTSTARTRTESPGSRTAARSDGNRAPSPVQIARAAAEQLTEISGMAADSISGLERTDDGWLVRVEVVEVARIPDSTSVMASYHVMVDADGTLQSYRREHRYYRNQAGES
jgi:hypothetical protein